MSIRFRMARPLRLTHEEQARQGRVVRAAQAAFMNFEAVHSFLNSHHPDLRGRPLDLAVQSGAGLRAVEAQILAERGVRGTGS